MIAFDFVLESAVHRTTLAAEAASPDFVRFAFRASDFGFPPRTDLTIGLTI
jgi:hypothetical protein